MPFAYLIAALAEVPDPRHAQGQRYGICHLLLFSALEVMGLSHALYRAKKQRLRIILTREPGRYLEHQAPDGIDRAEGDVQFRKDLRRFSKSVIDTPPPPSTSPPMPAAVALPPAPLPAPSQVLPPAPVLLCPAVSPAPAEVLQRLFGTPAPWSAAAAAAPAPGASGQPSLDDGHTLGRLAHRLLTALGTKR